MIHTQATPNEIARDIIAAHDLKTVEQARDYFLDDRSHGDEYAADAAGQFEPSLTGWIPGTSPGEVVLYVVTVLKIADQGRERDA